MHIADIQKLNSKDANSKCMPIRTFEKKERFNKIHTIHNYYVMKCHGKRNGTLFSTYKPGSYVAASFKLVTDTQTTTVP